MRWKTRQQSQNVEDRRGMPGGRMAIGGVGGLILIVVVLLLGGDPMKMIQMLTEMSPQATQQSVPGPQPEDEEAAFVSVVLRDTEDVWGQLFAKMGRQYREPKLVMFRGAVRSACGIQGSAVGPFYCPEDETVYIDLGFYEQMKTQLGAPGDFAQAYVIAHEIGHHVQKLMGITDRIHAAQKRATKTEANALSVRLELQADFLAGVWAHHAQKNWQILEPGDIEEALNAASAIGDDRLQKQAQGYVVPDAFTHGTSEQRVRWFAKGLKTGDIEQGDTFAPGRL